MNKQQRKQLRHQFKDSFFKFFQSQHDATMEITKINLWLVEHDYLECAVVLHSSYGYHILMSDSEFFNEKTI